MKFVFVLVASGLIATRPAVALMGDSLAQTIARYGQAIASAGQAGHQASTHTFTVSGLQITCGYVRGKVEMETYRRDDREFNPSEVEALLGTNTSGQVAWTTPAGGYVNGSYKRADGVTAQLDGNLLAIQSPKWLESVAKDQAARTAAEQSAAQAAAAANAAGNPNYSTGAGTNAASYVSPAETNAGTIPSPSSSVTTVTTTNAP